MPSNIELAELSSSHFPEPVPYAAITPSGTGPFPLCILLMGGGGSRQSLVDCQPLFEKWWAEGILAPMVFGNHIGREGFAITRSIFEEIKRTGRSQGRRR